MAMQQKPVDLERITLEGADLKRARAMHQYRQSLDGMGQGEIGQFWGLTRATINRSIAGLTEEDKAIVRRGRNREIQAAAMMRGLAVGKPDPLAPIPDEPRATAAEASHARVMAARESDARVREELLRLRRAEAASKTKASY